MDRIESHGCEEAPGAVEAMHYIGVPHSTQVAVWREVHYTGPYRTERNWQCGENLHERSLIDGKQHLRTKRLCPSPSCASLERCRVVCRVDVCGRGETSGVARRR